jgi:hypothetical protein
MCAESARDGRRALGRLLGQEERELVASKPTDDIPGASAVPQEVRDLLDQFVADKVSIAVVDRLQAAHVEVGKRERMIMPPGAGELSLDRLAKTAPVQSAGERIGCRVSLGGGDCSRLQATSPSRQDCGDGGRASQRDRDEKGQPDHRRHHLNQPLDRPRESQWDRKEALAVRQAGAVAVLSPDGSPSAQAHATRR